MTVLAWLLLCATVIQLGRSNYSISIDDGAWKKANSTLPHIDRNQVQLGRSNYTIVEGTWENASSASSISPPIDRSQARRARRSVDSDLEEAQKEFEKADRERNATLTALYIAEELLKTANASLIEAWKKSNGTKDRLDEASEADRKSKSAVAAATADKTKADTAVTDTEKAYNVKKETAWKPLYDDIWGKDLIPGLQELSKKANETVDEAKTALKEAKGASEKFNKDLSEYEDADTEVKNYGAAISTYAANKALSEEIARQELKKTNEELEEKANKAKETMNTAEKEKIELEKVANNEILKGTNTDLDKKLIKEIVQIKGESLATAEADLKKATDPIEIQKLETIRNQAKAEFNSIQELVPFDKGNTVGVVRESFTEKKREAEQCLNNNILNGQYTEKFDQKTVKVVLHEMTNAFIRAKNDNQANDEASIRVLEEKHNKNKRIRDALNKVINDYGTKTVGDLKRDFQVKKKTADETIALCNEIDNINGKVNKDFGKETVENAVKRLKTEHDEAKTKSDAEKDPKEKEKLEAVCIKAEKELKCMQQLEVAVGKGKLVEDAKKEYKAMKTVDATINENDILNEKIADDFGTSKILDILSGFSLSIPDAEKDLTEKKEKKKAFEDAGVRKEWIEQLQAIYGDNSIVAELIAKFKSEGKKNAETLIRTFDANAILSKKITKFDTKMIAEAIAEQEKVVTATKEAYDNGKNGPQKDTLKKEKETADSECNMLIILRKYDNALLGDLKKSIPEKTKKAVSAYTEAQTKHDTAKTALDAVNDIIAQARTDLNGVDEVKLLQQQNEASDAKLAIPAAQDKVKEYADKLDAVATTNNHAKGDLVEWKKLKVILEGKITAAAGEVTTKTKLAKKATDELIKKNNEAAKALKDLEDNEGGKKNNALEAQKQANAAFKAATAAIPNPWILEEATKEHNAAKAASEALEKDVAEKDNIVGKKKIADYDAGRKLDEWRPKLETAKKKKEESVQEAERLEREHQETIRMLTGAFAGLGGIVFCGIAIGLIAFLLMKRRKKTQKKKKSEKPEEPKIEEVDAPNGLTILRREGMYDKYVVKGDDIAYNGPLKRYKPPKDVPVKHRLEDQVGGEKIETIFFDKRLNGAWAVGEGVEEWYTEDDSTSRPPVITMDTIAFLDEPEDKAKSNKGDKKSAKRNGQKTPTKNPPSSSNDDQKKASTPSNPTTTP